MEKFTLQQINDAWAGTIEETFKVLSRLRTQDGCPIDGSPIFLVFSTSYEKVSDYELVEGGIRTAKLGVIGNRYLYSSQDEAHKVVCQNIKGSIEEVENELSETVEAVDNLTAELEELKAKLEKLS